MDALYARLGKAEDPSGDPPAIEASRSEGNVITLAQTIDGEVNVLVLSLEQARAVSLILAKEG